MLIAVALTDIYTISLSDAICVENRDAEQLRGFIDEVTREVAVLQGKFDHQEELVEAFGDDPADRSRGNGNEEKTRQVRGEIDRR
jgi:hypothetical protein